MAGHHRGGSGRVGRQLRGHQAAAADGRASLGVGDPRPPCRSGAAGRRPGPPARHLVVAVRGARDAQRRRLLPPDLRCRPAAPLIRRGLA